MDEKTFLISKENLNIRLDKLLADKYLLSRSYFQYLIDDGFVLINQKKIKKRFLPKENDEVKIFFKSLGASSLEPENISLDILYEDEDILAINKPVGMVVHPAHGNRNKTFVNALLYHCKEVDNIANDLRPGIVHRLDKNTSGVMLGAKNIKAQQKLIEAFKERKINKEYLAVCLNSTEDRVINEMMVSEDGKEAITEIKILKKNEKFSLILAKPKTGRTHQIRVHLKHVNCPVLGDDTYGSIHSNKFYKIERQFLHASKINFIHPTKNIEMTIEANISDDMKKFIDKII